MVVSCGSSSPTCPELISFVVFITISSVARIMITGFPDLYSKVNLNLTSKYSEI